MKGKYFTLRYFYTKKGKKKKKRATRIPHSDDTRSVHRHRRFRFRNHRSISKHFPLERDFRKTGKNARNECFPEEKEPRNFRGIVPRRFSSSSFASSVANRQTEGEFSIPRKFRTKGQCTYVSSPSPSLPRAPLV